jgi:hypothetical protein
MAFALSAGELLLGKHLAMAFAQTAVNYSWNFAMKVFHAMGCRNGVIDQIRQ